MIDVDRFKRFNDTHGHTEGDAVLRAVGREMRRRSRATDLVCRNGGEEFAVILPNTNPEGAMKLAERIREGVDGSPYTKHQISISVGIATHQTTSFSDTGKLINAADIALYKAKDQGRNCSVADRVAA
jgi:diguanylate cyclase (GGDEF)-like protein